MRTRLIAATLGLAALAGPALADRANDTLRLALAEPIVGVDVVNYTGGDMNFLNGAVFSSLFEYNPETRQMEGLLAERLEIVDPKTFMVYLKSGITFHDGSEFDADDVVYTLNFLSDPDIKFRLKTRFSWIKRAEKIDARTVKIHLREISAMAPVRLGVGMPIYPSNSHGALADPIDWARNPIGTGPYKVVSVDANAGIVMERFDGYVLGPKPDIGNFEVVSIPDPQSRMAAMMTGDIHVMAAYTPEDVKNITSLPGFKATALKDTKRIYLLTDAAGHSGVEALKDLRVREAIYAAIDRETLRKTAIAAMDQAPVVERICAAEWIGCPPGGTYPAYDPARAKALLAEAGYANGFDVEITTTVEYKTIAEAVSGYLRAVGINATVHSLPFTGVVKKQGDGQISLLLLIFSNGSNQDSGGVLSYFYASTTRDYAQNAELDRLMEESEVELDPAKRDEMMAAAFDIVDKERYVLPLAGNPSVYLHTDEIALDLTSSSLNGNFQYGTAMTFRWAD